MPQDKNKPVAKKFIFKSCSLDYNKKKAFFHYTIEFIDRPSLNFCETLTFPKSLKAKDINKELIFNALNDVHLILGISYYKLYCPPKIVVTSRIISEEQAMFWKTVYTKGLGEFFYKNDINPKNIIYFPFSNRVKAKNFSYRKSCKILLGIGGGKDSIVAGELLKKQKKDITALIIETQKDSQITKKVIDTMEVNSLKIKRNLDKKVFSNLEGSYNGHIPISAIFAFVGYFSAILYDYSYIVVGNEYSSNFGNLRYKGLDINHQWSKSLEFESLFQNYTDRNLSPNIKYFSILRSFYEIKIAEMFSKQRKYFSVFSSCNRSFKIHKKTQENLWCGECAKCVFVFTILSAFLKKDDLIKIFGKNLYEENSLSPLFSDILGYGKLKPFDCVGTFNEAQAALYLSKKNYGDSLIVKKFVKKIKNPEKLIKEVFTIYPSPDLPSQFSLLGLKKVQILGYGKEGKVTEQYLKKYYPEVIINIADKNISSDYLKPTDDDLIIKTPGIPGRLLSKPYITATNLFFSSINNRTIGITGSKGKSTTTSLIYNILKDAGYKVRILGNIGVPMLSALLKPIEKDEIFIIELSSYQLCDIKYSPHIAVVLNCFPEHMNYHNGVRNYFEAKKNIIKHQDENDYFVYNWNDKRFKHWGELTPAHQININQASKFKKIRTLLKGDHNNYNIMAAISVAKIFDIPEKIIINSVENFQPLSHRLEFVGSFSDILFYDDAISTTPESTIAALQTIPDVATVFLGGEDRGYNFSKLEKLLVKLNIKNIVLFPDSGSKILKSRKGLNVLETTNMKKAVEFAYKFTPKGSACLLSTASPSYSLWKNFEEKGDLFQKWVKNLS